MLFLPFLQVIPSALRVTPCGHAHFLPRPGVNKHKSLQFPLFTAHGWLPGTVEIKKQREKSSIMCVGTVVLLLVILWASFAYFLNSVVKKSRTAMMRMISSFRVSYYHFFLFMSFLFPGLNSAVRYRTQFSKSGHVSIK